MNPRSNDSAKILFVFTHGAQRGGGSKIDNQYVPAGKPCNRADNIRDFVGAHFQWVSVANLEARLRTRLKQKWPEAEKLAKAGSQRGDQIRNTRADSGHIRF